MNLDQTNHLALVGRLTLNLASLNNEGTEGNGPHFTEPNLQTPEGGQHGPTGCCHLRGRPRRVAGGEVRPDIAQHGGIETCRQRARADECCGKKPPVRTRSGH